MVSIVENVRRNRLKWLGYVLKREDTDAVRLVKGMRCMGIVLKENGEKRKTKKRGEGYNSVRDK